MNIEEKLNKLTTIPIKSLETIHDYLDIMHTHDIVTSMLEEDNTITLDIFEGKIILKLEDDTVKYKFIPSDTFNELVVDTVVNKKSKVVTLASDKLKNSLINWRKELL